MSEEEELPEILSEKELVETSLENPSKKPSKDNENSSIALELGDIIEIIAPNNQEVHEITGLIYYIDQTHINIICVSTSKRYILRLDGAGRLTDESIEQIYLLSRSDEKGYARQNNLLVGTWINIEFGGEIPVIITGQITNLEEDMIEVTTFPELRTIYIDFGYKGIPENIPIISILIREKPASLGPIKSLTTLKEEGELDQENADRPLASIEYTETGESIISIPEGSVPDENVRQNLHRMYVDANTIIFGERLGTIAHQVEIPENERRYGIESQVNDMMDELLATIPNSQRTKQVLDNIHRLIERFKELRTLFSKFDTANNVIDVKTSGAYYKPLVEHIESMDRNLKWLLPVVSLRRKLYGVDGAEPETPDTAYTKLTDSLREIEALQDKTSQEDYDTVEYITQEFMRPFDNPSNIESNCLASLPVNTNIDSIVDNLENFYSTVVANNNVIKRQFVIQRYNLATSKLSEQISKSGKSNYIREPIGRNDTMCVKSLIMLPYPIVKFSTIDLPTTNMLVKSTVHQNFFLLHKLLRKNVEIIPHIIDDLSKEFDFETLEQETGVHFLTGIHEFILDKDMPDQEQFDTNEKFKKFLETIIPKTRVLIRLVRKYIKDKISFLDVVQHLEPFAVYSSDITWKQYLEIRYFIKERMAELKKTVKIRGDEFSILKTTKYDIREKPNSILRLLSENSGFSELFFQTYQFLEKDKITTSMSSQEILNRIFKTDNGQLYTNIITSILISLMTPSNLVDELAGPQLDDLTDTEKIKPTDCTKRFLAKKYTSMKALQKDNNEEEVTCFI